MWYSPGSPLPACGLDNHLAAGPQGVRPGPTIQMGKEPEAQGPFLVLLPPELGSFRAST